MKSFKEDIDEALKTLEEIEKDEDILDGRIHRAEILLQCHRIFFRQYHFKTLITVVKWNTDTETRRYRHGTRKRDAWAALKDAVYKFYPRE